ncbi:MAG: dephospho-CoA kinase [Alphaproteobacteria bacterium]|jgi:dephospho-CoA kinase
MYILGLTGPIASGKSTVAQTFQQESIAVIDADQIVYDCYTAGTPVYEELTATYGKDIVCPSTGSIDRAKLSKIIQADAAQLNVIESIVHPQVRIVMKFQLAHAYSNRSKIIVLAIPLMFENGFNELCDSIVCCSCSLENRHRRFMERPKATEEKWQFITAKQMNDAEYIDRSDFIINTDCSELESAHKTIEITNILSGEDGIVWHDKWRYIG